MFGSELKFIMLGYTNSICANRIIAVMRPNASAAKRLLKEARRKELGHLDLTFGRATRSLLLLDDQTIVECALMPKTVFDRLNGTVNANTDEIEDTEEDEMDEDNPSKGGHTQ